MKKPEMLFDLDTIREAVDIAIGDDGMRGEEVCAILERVYKEDYEKYDGLSGDEVENVTHVNLFERDMKQYEKDGVLQVVEIPEPDENDAKKYREQANVVRISDINKEIAKEWNKDEEEE